MVRDEGILAHLRELDEATGDWERYRSTITLEDLRTDRDKRNMVLHALLVSIQASIDIANHLIAVSSSRRPETYRESFAILCDEGLIRKTSASSSLTSQAFGTFWSTSTAG